MAKLQAKVLRKFPEVEVFVEQTKTLARGIHRMWLLRSNGINMLVANSSCNVLLVPLREVKVVAPRNNDYFICHSGLNPEPSVDVCGLVPHSVILTRLRHHHHRSHHPRTLPPHRSCCRRRMRFSDARTSPNRPKTRRFQGY